MDKPQWEKHSQGSIFQGHSCCWKPSLPEIQFWPLLGQAFYYSFYTAANGKLRFYISVILIQYKLIHNKDFNYLKKITGKGSAEILI